jgi:type IV secretory pathway TrbL component
MRTPTGLTRRAFLKVGASAAAAGLAGCAVPGDRTTTGAAAKSGTVSFSGVEFAGVSNLSQTRRHEGDSD